CIDGLVSNFDKAAARQKRGGGAAVLHFDFEGAREEVERVIGHAESAESLFEQEWVRGVFATALRRLRDACATAGKSDHYTRLEHPGIVPVHDVGLLPDGRPFYTMKWVQGDRLDRALARPLPLAERLRLFLRIAEAVAFAHAQGVLHRDLKPENVMVGAFGEV